MGRCDTCDTWDTWDACASQSNRISETDFAPLSSLCSHPMAQLAQFAVLTFDGTAKSMKR